MTFFDDAAKTIRDIDKRGKLVRRKRRQKAKQKKAKAAGDIEAVKRLAAKKDQTNKKRKKAQKEVNKIGTTLIKRGSKAGIIAAAGGGNPAALTAAGLAFIA